jgi:hypothetical protein
MVLAEIWLMKTPTAKPLAWSYVCDYLLCAADAIRYHELQGMFLWWITASAQVLRSVATTYYTAHNEVHTKTSW